MDHGTKRFVRVGIYNISMRIKELKIGNEVLRGANAEQRLHGSPHDWLLACEFDDAVIEIVNGSVIWKDGVMYWGEVEWCIFEGGSIRGGSYKHGILRSSVATAKNIDTSNLLNIK